MINFRSNNLVRDGFTRPDDESVEDGRYVQRIALSGYCDNAAHSRCPIPERCKCECHDDNEDGPSLTEDGEPIYRSVNCSRCGKQTSYDPIYGDLCGNCCRAENE